MNWSKHNPNLKVSPDLLCTTKETDLSLYICTIIPQSNAIVNGASNITYSTSIIKEKKKKERKCEI